MEFLMALDGHIYWFLGLTESISHLGVLLVSFITSEESKVWMNKSLNGTK
jgi:hypothetical protein